MTLIKARPNQGSSSEPRSCVPHSRNSSYCDATGGGKKLSVINQSYVIAEKCITVQKYPEHGYF